MSISPLILMPDWAWTGDVARGQEELRHPALQRYVVVRFLAGWPYPSLSAIRDMARRIKK